MLNKFFKLNEHNTTLRREVIVEFTTFLRITYSISMELTFGFPYFILMKLVTGRAQYILPVMLNIGLFSAFNLILMM